MRGLQEEEAGPAKVQGRARPARLKGRKEDPSRSAGTRRVQGGPRAGEGVGYAGPSGKVLFLLELY